MNKISSDLYRYTKQRKICFKALNYGKKERKSGWKVQIGRRNAGKAAEKTVDTRKT